MGTIINICLVYYVNLTLLIQYCKLKIFLFLKLILLNSSLTFSLKCPQLAPLVHPSTADICASQNQNHYFFFSFTHLYIIGDICMEPQTRSFYQYWIHQLRDDFIATCVGESQQELWRHSPHYKDIMDEVWTKFWQSI